MLSLIKVNIFRLSQRFAATYAFGMCAILKSKLLFVPLNFLNFGDKVARKLEFCISLWILVSHHHCGWIEFARR